VDFDHLSWAGGRLLGDNGLGRNESEGDVDSTLHGDKDSHEAGVVCDHVLTNEVANNTNSESGEVDPNGLGL